MNQQNAPMKAGSDTGTRIFGFVMFLIGMGLGYWQIYSPIEQAVRGEKYIDYFPAATLAAPLGAIFGLFLIVFGAEGLEVMQKRPSKGMMVLIAVLVILLTLGCMFGMEFIMKSLGYGHL